MIKIIVGTRPEIIKMSPVIHECIERDITFEIIHSGQHYSDNMDKIFFNQLNIPYPIYNANIGQVNSSSGLDQINKISSGIGQYISSDDIVLVQGDTNTVAGATKCALNKGAIIGHIEAGLRSFDITMPEELNRIFVDHSSDFLFAPTVTSCNNLRNDNIGYDNIFLTGNTIVDTIQKNLHEIDKIENPFDNYVLATIHRQENVNNISRLQCIIECFNEVKSIHDKDIIFPVHPRTFDSITKYNMDISNIILLHPIGYFDFLKMEKGADLIITDSGGVQEEACILETPCVTIRDNTERPETLDVGSNMLTSCDESHIHNAINTMLGKSGWSQPFGNGRASKIILDILDHRLGI